jgi:hypothetical protein
MDFSVSSNISPTRDIFTRNLIDPVRLSIKITYLYSYSLPKGKAGWVSNWKKHNKTKQNPRELLKVYLYPVSVHTGCEGAHTHHNDVELQVDEKKDQSKKKKNWRWDSMPVTGVSITVMVRPQVWPCVSLSQSKEEEYGR